MFSSWIWEKVFWIFSLFNPVKSHDSRPIRQPSNPLFHNQKSFPYDILQEEARLRLMHAVEVWQKNEGIGDIYERKENNMKTTLSRYICGMLRSSCFMLPLSQAARSSLSLNPWLDAHLYAYHLLCLGRCDLFPGFIWSLHTIVEIYIDIQ